MRLLDQQTAEGILFTDEYQLTMAQFYYRMGVHEQPAQFDHFFRHYPNYGLHQAGYCINAGLEWLIDWMQEAHFQDKDLDYLRSQTTRTGKRLFQEDFLGWLKANGNFKAISLDAIPEGRVVHPQVPLTSVRGPLAMAQILESPLLNFLNYQTLIATKAARIKNISRSNLLLEFGMRRGQSTGANAGARAAMIGGADFTSNAGISHVLGYPPKGTHAHSMVQLFIALGLGELEAFRAFSEIYPDDCVLLVDTVNTLESGLPNAIRVFEELRRKGHEPVGVRLDSGDLAYLAVQTARMLDEAGFSKTSITLSNELDEMVIWQIRTQIQAEAPRYGVDPDRLLSRLVYGVGTHLITSEGCPALDGVYKLVAVQKDDTWKPALKISETPGKTPNPGHKKVWRLYDKRGKAVVDLLGLAGEEPGKAAILKLHHPVELNVCQVMNNSEIAEIETLQVPVLDQGRLVYRMPGLEEIRSRQVADLDRLDEGVKRLVNPHIYHVSLTENLWQLKQELITAATHFTSEPEAIQV
ncbi:MAG: nicotinate phosphoribosyltransferase [Chloroflexi bacterium]|nr:nicotinate phosphoribosyltransferase [Chloroflexota bacterium]OJW01895.1 MAG: nicotinate phosphoribosyltransferase [Chloroflexi bacterium 54-19]